MQTNDPILAGIARLREVRQKRQQELDEADAPRKKREQEAEERRKQFSAITTSLYRADEIRSMQDQACMVSRILLGEHAFEAPESAYCRVYCEQGKAALRCCCLRKQEGAPFTDGAIAVYDPSLEAAAAACAAAGHASHKHFVLDERVRGADLPATQVRWSDARVPGDVWIGLETAIREYMYSSSAGRNYSVALPDIASAQNTRSAIVAELAKYKWAFGIEVEVYSKNMGYKAPYRTYGQDSDNVHTCQLRIAFKKLKPVVDAVADEIKPQE